MGAEFEKQVSVIMGVYNQWNREALQKAVKSILNQTLTDFEFIIYDDGSDPEVAGYIRELEKLDERIVLIGKEENHGLAFSLNMCIGAAKGKYIARMDADDIALPERLQVQYDFMEQHKEYAWCGCNTRLFDENGIWGERKMPELPSDKDYLPFSPFIHPTVMYRRKLFEKMRAIMFPRKHCAVKIMRYSCVCISLVIRGTTFSNICLRTGRTSSLFRNADFTSGSTRQNSATGILKPCICCFHWAGSM